MREKHIQPSHEGFKLGLENTMDYLRWPKTGREGEEFSVELTFAISVSAVKIGNINHSRGVTKGWQRDFMYLQTLPKGVLYSRLNDIIEGILHIDIGFCTCSEEWGGRQSLFLTPPNNLVWRHLDICTITLRPNDDKGRIGARGCACLEEIFISPEC